MPKAGAFYSVTSVGSHTEGETPWTLGEEFGYGIMDKLAVSVSTSLSENNSFDQYVWNDLGVKATFRAFEKSGIVADVYGEYANRGTALLTAYGRPNALMYYPNAEDKTEWFDKDMTSYIWTAGVRGGYMASNWTVAGHVAFSYLNSESFNWGDKGTHMLSLGLDGQFVINDSFNLVAGAEYVGVTNDHVAYDDMEDPAKTKNAGSASAYFGVNYNFDSTKFIGAYINGSLNHQGGDSADEWEWDDGFGYGVRFGIQF